MKWNRLSDLKPQTWRSYIVAYDDPNGPLVCQATLQWNGRDFTVNFSDQKYAGEVTHWMALPEPPAVSF